jgi:hypothetical protein
MLHCVCSTIMPSPMITQRALQLLCQQTVSQMRSVPAVLGGARHHSHRASFPLERAAILEERATIMEAVQKREEHRKRSDNAPSLTTVRWAIVRRKPLQNGHSAYDSFRPSDSSSTV